MVAWHPNGSASACPHLSPPPCGRTWEQFPARGCLSRAGEDKGEAPRCLLQCHCVSLQLLGFFKGMSFPIASIAVVNSVLFGVYSNTLLLLTATSHQERRAQPPSYMHIFLAGCTGGFLQVRGQWVGTHECHRDGHVDLSSSALLW